MPTYLTCFLAAAASPAAPAEEAHCPAPLIRSRPWRYINLLTYLLTYTLSDVRDCLSVHNGDVPREAATFQPRDQSETVWPLAIRADQPSWLLCCGNVCTSKGPVDQVIELLVADASAGALSAREAMRTTGVNHGATRTLVRLHISSPSRSATATLTASFFVIINKT